MFTRRRQFLRTAPLDTGDPNPQGGGDAPAADPPTPPVPPVPPTPPAFDPNTLTPEARAYMDAQVKTERDKTRNFEKANAAKAEREKLLDEFRQKLGLGDQPIDPARVAGELEQVRESNRVLRVDRAISDAARKAGGDDELIAAKLMRDGKLTGLDPAADGFADKIKKLVDDALTANPRLKIDATAPTLPGGVGPVAPVNGGGERRAGSLGDALTAHYAKK